MRGGIAARDNAPLYTTVDVWRGKVLLRRGYWASVQVGHELRGPLRGAHGTKSLTFITASTKLLKTVWHHLLSENLVRNRLEIKDQIDRSRNERIQQNRCFLRRLTWY